MTVFRRIRAVTAAFLHVPLALAEPPGLRVLAAAAAAAIASSSAWGLDSKGKLGPGEEYLTRLAALASAYSESELHLSAWCASAGLAEDAATALGRASAVNPAAKVPPPFPGPAPASPAAELEGRIKVLRASVSRDYASLAKWCLSKGLLYEARRSVEKALRWNPADSEAKSLAIKPALKARYLHDVLCGSPQGVFRGGKWVPEEGFRKSSEARVRGLAESHSKSASLEFKADFLPDVDMLFTVGGEEFKAAKSAIGRFLSLTRGVFFLSSPKKPVLFFYLSGEEEFRKLGQNPMMMGAYEWGKGRLYAYPGFMAEGTILHEMTHAMLEACFRTFPPLWFNEGLACFFETFADLSSDTPFGVANWRDAMYAQAVSSGKARSLEDLTKNCAMMIDPLGYGQGRALMNYLWSLGRLEAFVVSAQLRDDGRLDFAAVLSDVLGAPLAIAGADLEKFALANAKQGVLIPRGRSADETIDGPMGDGPDLK